MVVTEAAWKLMQLRGGPARVNLLSLGRHLIRPGLELNLMQSTPSMAPGTTFAPLSTLGQLTAGYSESPDAARGVAIVFCRFPGAERGEVRRWAAGGFTLVHLSAQPEPFLSLVSPNETLKECLR